MFTHTKTAAKGSVVTVGCEREGVITHLQPSQHQDFSSQSVDTG